MSMHPLVLFGIAAMFLIPALAVWIAIMSCRRQIVRSPSIDRTEKNGHHLATGVIALIGVGLGVLAPIAIHPILWGMAGFVILFVISVRLAITELGIRRRHRLRGSRKPSR